MSTEQRLVIGQTADAGAAATPSVDDHPLLSRRYKTWLVFVLLVASTFNFADRAIVSVLAQPIKEDLGLTDTHLGMLQGVGFAILYSILGVPLGWLAERISRKGLIAACFAAWSFMTAACGMATSFITLLLARVGVGIGEAGFQPASASLLADHFKANRRASVLAIVMLGSPIGFLLGQSVGGWVAAEWNWRVAFYALGVPGIIAAAIVWFTLREPPRGLAEGSVSKAKPPRLLEVIRHLWSMQTFRHLLFGSTIAGFALNAVAHFVLPFYLRGFGLSIALVGALFGMVAFTSNGIGMLLGGFGFDRLSRRDPRWSLWGPAVMLVLAVPLYCGAFATRNPWTSMAFIWFANLVLISYFAPTAATMQNIVGPRMRATTAALTAVVAGIFGAGLGPTLLGIASDWFATRAFELGDFIASCPGGRAPPGAGEALDGACRAASTEGLRHALIAVQVFFVWAAAHYVLAARTLRQHLFVPSAPPATQGA
ncbi:MAG: MFS transporter [Pseudomonadota bacterium]|jgi:Arabinose efflux permease